MTCDFSFKHYTETLRQATKTYTFYTFKDFPDNSNEKYILLRHDIDASLNRALRMATIENDLGICSTFFIRLHAPLATYNLNNNKDCENIHKILNMQHEIGLHYEPKFYLEHPICMSVKERIKTEAKSLGKKFNIEIKSIAPHLTDYYDKLREKYGEISPPFIEAYPQKFSSKPKYISDSRKRWHEDCMCRWIGRETKLQILCHPCWWNGRSKKEVDELL